MIALLGSWACAAPGAEPVEWPQGKPHLEESEQTLARRRDRCEGLEKLFKGDPSSEGAERLLFCLSHPSSEVRASTLRALAHHGYTRAFPVQAYDQLKKALELTSKDPELEVRYASGDLSRAIQHWENFDSPAAAERRQAHSDFKEREFVTEWEVLIVLCGMVLFLGWLGSGPKAKRTRRS